METVEKLRILEELIETDPGELKENMFLNELEEWDSFAALSLIVLLEDKFGREISGEEIKQLKTVQDILDLMCEDQ